MGNSNKLGFWVLTALVVGNMVGSGIFMLPRTLSEAASPAGVIVSLAFYRTRCFDDRACIR